MASSVLVPLSPWPRALMKQTKVFLFPVGGAGSCWIKWLVGRSRKNAWPKMPLTINQSISLSLSSSFSPLPAPLRRLTPGQTGILEITHRRLLRPRESNANASKLQVGTKWVEDVGGGHKGVVRSVANLRVHAYLKAPSADRSSKFFERDKKSTVLCEKSVTRHRPAFTPWQLT